MSNVSTRASGCPEIKGRKSRRACEQALRHESVPTTSTTSSPPRSSTLPERGACSQARSAELARELAPPSECAPPPVAPAASSLEQGTQTSLEDLPAPRVESLLASASDEELHKLLEDLSSPQTKNPIAPQESALWSGAKTCAPYVMKAAFTLGLPILARTLHAVPPPTHEPASELFTRRAPTQSISGPFLQI